MRTIIVASDAPTVRGEVIAALGDTSTRIVEIADGAEVAAAVDEHAPGLVVVDLQMGNMGAMAVCMELRLEASYGNLSHVPVLMLLDRRADVFLARRSAAEGWLVKPLDPIRLRRAATALIDGGTYHDRSFRPVPVAVATAAPVPAAGSGEPEATEDDGTGASPSSPAPSGPSPSGA